MEDKPDIDEASEYLTVEAAHREMVKKGFDFSIKKVRHLAVERIIPFFKPPLTRRLYIRREALEAWLKSLEPTLKPSK